MARKKRGRNVNGILLLDKPVGASSNHVLQKVRRLFGAAKAGHTGSLDPLASGMLPICFGEATKFSQYLLNSDKAYQVTAKLGETTTTADAEGEILQSREVTCTKEQLLEVLELFRGETMQVPSMFSALKHEGTPLYKLARQGIEVERKARPIRIDKLEVTDYQADSFSLDVECSKGTYIRNLVEDIGEKLGCGAHVTMLRRTWVAHFDYQDLITVEELEQLAPARPVDKPSADSIDEESYQSLDELLLPIDEALEGYPEYKLDADSAFYFLRGQATQCTSRELDDAEVIKVYDEQGRFLGVGSIDDDLLLAPKRLIAK